jgi:hypothetical protein
VHLQIHAIAKLEQFKNVLMHQPVDQLHAEMHTLNNAELSQNATTILNQKHVERTVTIMLNVLLILAMFLLETANTLQTTMHVTITMHVLLTDVLLKDASTPTKIVPMEMHVPETSVIPLPDNVFLPQSFVLPPSAKLENAILNLDAKLLQETATMELHVPLIAAEKIVDATMHQMTKFVTIKMTALLIDVISNLDVFTPRLNVTITILAPLMFAQAENANSSMHANHPTNAPSLLAMQLEDANQPQRTVMTTMHVPLIAAILLSDVSTLQSLATTMIFATSPTAAQ